MLQTKKNEVYACMYVERERDERERQRDRVLVSNGGQGTNCHPRSALCLSSSISNFYYTLSRSSLQTFLWPLDLRELFREASCHCYLIQREGLCDITNVLLVLQANYTVLYYTSTAITLLCTSVLHKMYYTLFITGYW
jgi:hypothetical protein